MKKEIIRRKSADNTREKIIKSASKLFAQQGFSATSTQAIAKSAKVNEALIFHHFCSKSNLWQIVKSAIVSKINVIPISQQPNSLKEFLTEIFNQRLSCYQQRPELIRLIQWQRLEAKRDGLIAGNLLAPTHWLAGIKHLQKNKMITKEMPAELILAWIAATINAVIFDETHLFRDEKLREKYLSSVVERMVVVLALSKSGV